MKSCGSKIGEFCLVVEVAREVIFPMGLHRLVNEAVLKEIIMMKSLILYTW